MPSAKIAAPRLTGVDVLRGLAIFTMVFANAAAVILVHPHPWGVRLYGTFAAPTFVMLSGMMVALSVARDREQSRDGELKYTLGYYLVRGGLVFLIAILVDLVVNGYWPLCTFDVLYVIGLSLPLAYLLARAPSAVRIAAPLAIFAVTPGMQSWFGYRTEIVQPEFDLHVSEVLKLWPDHVRRLVIDGWFPLFPWVGFSLMGVALESLRRRDGLTLQLPPWFGPATLLAGVAWWVSAPGPMVERAGYTEMFYPVSPGFAMTAIGLLMTLLPLSQTVADSTPGRWLQVFGRCSLAMYILHSLVINSVLKRLFHDLTLLQFIAVYLPFLVLLWIVARGIDVLKGRLKARGIVPPVPVAVLLGG